MTRALALALTLAATAACGDKVIEMTLQTPPEALAAGFDASCAVAVEVYVLGGDYPDDEDDFIYACGDLDPAVDHAGYPQLVSALRGYFDIELPESGLSGIEVYGYAASCDVVDDVHDLIFQAGKAYTGGGSLALPLRPSLSCTESAITVRPIDILKLSATRTCGQAAVAAGKIATTALSSELFFDDLYLSGGLAAGDITGGVATFSARTKVGGSTLALLHSVGDQPASLALLPPAAQQVCAAGAEIEAATIPPAVALASRDPAQIAQLGGVVFGVVYGAAGPVTGATVTVAGDQLELAQVVYLDLPPGVENGTGALTVRQAGSTGPSGLFAVYTFAMLDVTISAGGRSVQRKLGAATDPEDLPGAIIVKL